MNQDKLDWYYEYDDFLENDAISALEQGFIEGWLRGV